MWHRAGALCHISPYSLCANAHVIDAERISPITYHLLLLT